MAIVVMMALCVTVTAHAQSDACDPDAKKKAKDYFHLAEASKKVGAYQQAVDAYLEAYKLCPRPFLLFNAGQLYWIQAEREKAQGQRKDARALQAKALVLYEQYIETEPTGQGAELAQEQFFEVAEELAIEGRTEDAERYYEWYLELAPNGSRAAEAKVWLTELPNERKRLQRQADQRKQRERQRAAENRAAWDKLIRERNARATAPRPPAPRRTGYRIGLLLTASVSTVSAIVAVTHAGDNADAPPRYRYPGIALVSGALAGFFLYKGYLQKPASTRSTSATIIQPTISPTGVGIGLSTRF